MIFGIGTVFCHILNGNILINMLKNIIDCLIDHSFSYGNALFIFHFLPLCSFSPACESIQM